MQILDFQLIDEPSGRHRAAAVFDLQLTPECRLYGLRLLRMADGRLLTFAPQAGYRRVATFAAPLASEITKLATDELRALTANGIHKAA
ncbi:hypothetical protein KYK30_14265 [Shinella yambaruensis]|uniref:Uncharacterized protein n=1 Tax=Shinella yambaruensis TaxID=415996 RepID=A0ABQ5ZG32_9HYPH|nr:hypothetical protein [Shinella yambaruensis]MCJ8024420.1 hypothetical protein [Shinella yambaruensis]MCU7980862.1 hypothetical protein [Shinella yambaruensis]GLR49719.1 hypothetical protein GCM10007923_09240 [Shinella yambaruensis]